MALRYVQGLCSGNVQENFRSPPLCRRNLPTIMAPPRNNRRQFRRRQTMKFSLLRAAVASAFLLGLMSTGVRAQGNDNDGCSDATLRGDYGFTVSGQIFMPGPNNTTVVIQRDGV